MIQKYFVQLFYSKKSLELNLLVDVLLIQFIPNPEFKDYKQTLEYKPRDIDFVEIAEQINKLGYNVTYKGIVDHYNWRKKRLKLRRKKLIQASLDT